MYFAVHNDLTQQLRFEVNVQIIHINIYSITHTLSLGCACPYMHICMLALGIYQPCYLGNTYCNMSSIYLTN